ncbi:MAG: type II toxin-antitoxin system HicA family toxin [Candidatus Kapabacteria bacterium]|nr:type II toxin-antitoxin system HicA family toxin [Candidatus Kapabacteria bacterium]
MSRKEKLLKRLLSLPKDFTYNELKLLLVSFNYIEYTLGKTSGSRVAFYNKSNNHIIRLHKPHPSNILKRYQINLIIEELNKNGLLNER